MKHRLSLNSFLLSTIINMALLTGLSLYSEHSIPQLKEKFEVSFVSLPKARITQRRSVSIDKRFDDAMASGGLHSGSEARYLSTTTYRSIIREAMPFSNDPEVIGVIKDMDADDLSMRFSHRQSLKGASEASASSGIAGSGSSKGKTYEAGGKIQPDESSARISGSGNVLTGYYNMSLVRYEDSSDNISTDALSQLAGAMNRWTQVKTRVIKKPMRLDDPKLAEVPLIYIASRRPFAFSERERQNLQRFFNGGGFMIFSNVADSDNRSLEVANSIGFELWKIMGEVAHNLSEIDRSHGIYNSFFPLSAFSVRRDSQRTKRLPDILGIDINGRIIFIYEDTGYGSAWASGKNEKQNLEMGVNIIAYALITNPNVTVDR